MACLLAASLIISTKVRYRLRCGSGRYSDSRSIMEPPEMTKRRFAKRSAFVLVMVTAFAAPAASAQSAQDEPVPAKAGKLMNVGDVLSGELNAMKVRGGKRGAKTSTYQITSEPRRLPP